MSGYQLEIKNMLATHLRYFNPIAFK